MDSASVSQKERHSFQAVMIKESLMGEKLKDDIIGTWDAEKSLISQDTLLLWKHILNQMVTHGSYSGPTYFVILIL